MPVRCAARSRRTPAAPSPSLSIIAEPTAPAKDPRAARRRGKPATRVIAWKYASESCTRRASSSSRWTTDQDPDTLAADASRRRSPRASRVFWLTDTKGRKVGVPTDKIAYVEIAGRGRGSQGRLRLPLDASVHHGDRVIGPAPDLLDRRLLFFTGKGGVGKSTMAAATALLAAEHRQARPAHRGRRQGRHPRAVRAARRSGSRRARCIPVSSRWRWTPRRRCRSTCGSTCGCR